MITLRKPGAAARRWRVAAAGLVGLAAAWGAAYVVGSRRAAAMSTAAVTAQTAVAAARAGAAATWAPEQLLAAERAWGAAEAARRIEETRLWPIPDSARVVEAFASAEGAARDALARAGEERAVASEAARSIIADAGAAVEAGERLAATIHLGAARRALVSQARAALTEASVYAREEEFSSAKERARQAIALTAQVRDLAAGLAARYADPGTLARWRAWKDETIAWSRREGRPAVVVTKEPHTLTLYVRGEPVRTYRVELGNNWIADKSHAGDGATPEGRYRIVARKGVGASVYYKALLLDYPNAQDRVDYARARRRGEVPASAGIGGLIEIHGMGGRGRDWTKGCVALTNADIDELFSHVGVGTPVTIVGNDSHGAIADLAVGRGTSTVAATHRP